MIKIELTEAEAQIVWDALADRSERLLKQSQECTPIAQTIMKAMHAEKAKQGGKTFNPDIFADAFDAALTDDKNTVTIAYRDSDFGSLVYDGPEEILRAGMMFRDGVVGEPARGNASHHDSTAIYDRPCSNS